MPQSAKKLTNDTIPSTITVFALLEVGSGCGYAG